MSFSSAYTEIVDNLSFLDDWEDRYRYLIELGQALPPLGEDERNAQNKVSGCTSQVWLVVEGDAAALQLRGDSDAMIVKGLVAVLLALYSSMSAQQAADTDAIEQLDAIGLREHLTTQRSNGLVAMVRRIREEAAARI